MKQASIYQASLLVALFLAPLGSVFLPDVLDETSALLSLSAKDVLQILALFVLYSMLLVSKLAPWAARVLRIRGYYESVAVELIYDDACGVHSRISYVYVAGWSRASRDLPPEAYFWQKAFNEKKFYFRLIHRGKLSDRRIEPASLEVSRVTLQRYKGDSPTSIAWQAKVDPPLLPKERISYQAEVYTPNTEALAFESSGSTIGAAVPITTLRASMRAFAPIGFSFTVLEPRVTVRDLMSAEQVLRPRIAESTLAVSPDRTVLSWEKSFPTSPRRYWAHFRFERNADGRVEE